MTAIHTCNAAEAGEGYVKAWRAYKQEGIKAKNLKLMHAHTVVFSINKT